VITWVDNDFTFQWLSKKYKNAEFYAIQNGGRLKSCLTTKDSKEVPRKISMPHFVCFGQNVVDNYRKFGHEIDDPICLGSLKAGYYQQVIKKNPAKKIFDICIVPQGTIEVNEKLQDDWMKNDQIIFDIMAQYIKKNNTRVAIALRSSTTEEYEFFFKKFGDTVTIVRQHENDRYSTYRTMDNSEVIINNYSTAGFEAFGWGKKVLFCNFYGDAIYEIFSKNLFSVKNLDYTMFEKELNKLLAMDQDEYMMLTKIQRKYIMNYDPELPVHEYMKNIIRNLINEENYPHVPFPSCCIE
jgi:surface carbohydrate biosynthesis protein